MPDNHLAVLADRIADCPTPAAAWNVSRQPPVREYMLQASTIVTAWQARPETTGAAIALALRTATATRHHLRREQDVQLVWTGPTTPHVRAQPTSEIVERVINSAKRDLLLVSFATYPEPRVHKALQAAVQRGVNVAVLTENSEAAEGQYTQSSKDPFQGMD